MRAYINFLLCISSFLILLFLVYFLYISLFRVDVVFYSSIYSSLITLILFSLAIYRSKYLNSVYSTYELFNVVVICFLLGYVFSISIPTVIDRSLSFYILEKLDQRGGGIKLSKFDYIFTNEYMREHRLVDIRLTEQERSGTIIIDDGCVRLTPKGVYLAEFSRFFRANFLPKRRLLRGQYTDELIDPFSRSDVSPDYLCN